MRQAHRKEVDLALVPCHLRQRLAKIDLRMARSTPQRHEHLATPQPSVPDPAGVTVLVAKPFEDRFNVCRWSRGSTFIRRQDPVEQAYPAETAEAYSDSTLNFGIPPKLMMLYYGTSTLPLGMSRSMLK